VPRSSIRRGLAKSLTEEPDVQERPYSRPFDRYREAISGALRRTRETWPGLSTYQRFEQVVSLAITMLVSVLVLVTVFHLTARIAHLVLLDLTESAQQEAFQVVFGMIMTVLMALEFNHSILSVLERRHGVVQVRTVVLIALLALVRKFVIVDVENVAPVTMLGLAASALALGSVYWLLREQDEVENRGSLP
jgi:uncharacterized membrane protein (DUF373 family)